jgi:pimeloyl-ACP methyl ester carboxylesterase
MSIAVATALSGVGVVLLVLWRRRSPGSIFSELQDTRKDLSVVRPAGPGLGLGDPTRPCGNADEALHELIDADKFATHCEAMQSVSGVELHVRGWKRQNETSKAKEEKTVAFLFHGLHEHCHRRSFDRLAVGLLAPEDSSSESSPHVAFDEVWALDHQGHGLSGGSATYAKDWYELVQDAVALVDAKCGDINVVFGHSMGGLIAFHVTKDRPETFAKGCAVFSGAALALNESEKKMVPIVSLISRWLPRMVVHKLEDNLLVCAGPEHPTHVEAAADPLYGGVICARFGYGIVLAQVRQSSLLLPCFS